MAMIALVSSTSAQVVTNVFSGEVTKLFVGPDSLDHPANSSDGPATGGVFAGLRTGDSVSLSFVFDPLAEPIWTDSAGGYQYALLSWSIVAGRVSISGAGRDDLIEVHNDSDNADGLHDLFAVIIQSGYWAGVAFEDRSLTALHSATIPTTFTLGDWDQQILEFDSDGYFQLPGTSLVGSEDNIETVSAYFRVNDFYSSVPEPSAVVLFGTGCLGLLLAVRGVGRRA